MELKMAIETRKSIRGYLAKPVGQETVEAVLNLATRAVSALNMQPWEFVVVTGEALERIKDANVKDLRGGVPFDVSEPEAGGVYRTRRIQVAKQLFAAMDIDREDKARRNWWLERGFRFFDAPVLLLICADPAMDEKVARLDIGCVTQNICLAAMEYGLGTCAQSQAVMFQRGLKENIPCLKDKIPVVGIAMGYPDDKFPANEVVSEREPCERIVRWMNQ